MLDVPLRGPLFRIVLLCLAVLGGCKTQPTQPVEPPTQDEARYERVAWSSLPGWAQDSIGEAWPAFQATCVPPQKQAQWRVICADAQAISARDAHAQRRFFETRFEPLRLLRDTGQSLPQSEGLITGYYEPLLHGSRQRSAAYAVPLYGVPSDLLTIDLAAVHPELAGKRLRGRLQGNKVVPYYSRAEIDAAPSVRGKELVWVSDAVDAFFLQVQGSGRVQLDTGETIRMQFADVNGQPYRSIGRYLVDQGALTLDEATAPNIRAWIRNHPERAREVLNANPSVVFFTETPLRDPRAGPKGALGVPLTAGRSVAVDPRYIPLGTPVFITTTDPLTQTPLRRLMMAQDTGGAIKGILRADWFFGFGATAAEQAGHMRSQGSFWLLWPKGMALPEGGG